jgi:hypothetical protein
MAAFAHVEHAGVPIDVPLLNRLRLAWGDIIDRLIAAVDGSFGFYEGRSFRMSRFRDWLVEQGRHWPSLPSGQLDLEDGTFRDMAKLYPDLMSIHELRATLSGLRLESLQVGDDGRNRVLLSAYRALTSRNAPSNAKFVFGPATWLRGLIKPPPGRAFVYIDWASQEIGIGAALSVDERMMGAYRSGDFYLGFAKQVGLAPPDATKHSHGPLRDMIKTVCLGLGYGMGRRTLAYRLGISEAAAAELISLYWGAYPRFERWVESAVDHAMLWNSIPTVFGWPIHIEGRFDPHITGSRPNPRALRNFPCQGNGAEILRLAICLGVERGVTVVAPVHDDRNRNRPHEGRHRDDARGDVGGVPPRARRLRAANQGRACCLPRSLCRSARCRDVGKDHGADTGPTIGGFGCWMTSTGWIQSGSG